MLLPFAGEAVPAYVALGANLGDRLGMLRQAAGALGRHPRIRLVHTSPVYETAAHTLPGSAPQPDYLNAVAALHTSLSAEELLAYCLEVEQNAGRRRAREQRWAARTLDLDVILYGRETKQTEALTVPHPRLGERRFVLQPLADIAANHYVPAPFDSTVADLLKRCPDPDRPVRTAYRL